MGLLSRNIQIIPPSETLALVARAAQLRAEGKKVISFAAGELDFPTPQIVVDGTIEALRGGWTKYTPSAGLTDMRKAVARTVTRLSGVEVSDANVAVTMGAKQGIFNVLMAILDPGDGVLVVSPYWVSYPSMVMLAGGTPVIHETKPDSGFKISGAEIARIAATKKLKAVIINSPSNPTGSVYSPGELVSVYEACRKAGIFLISDEIYAAIVFDGVEHFSALQLERRITDGFCIVDGMSKSFAMTGWRIGWVVGTTELIGAVSKISAQTTTCATSFIQKGCVDALDSIAAMPGDWMAQLRQRREKIVSLLCAVEGVACRKPDGAFYAWADVREILRRRLPDGSVVGTSDRLSRYLMEDGALIVVPGGAFGCEGFMRFSFAVSMKEIEEGIEIFRRGVEKLS
jgi:aspartate aminotransferase